MPKSFDILSVLDKPEVAADLTGAPVEELFDTWVALDTLEKGIAPQKSALRDLLLAHAQELGSKDDSGSDVLAVGGSLVKRELRRPNLDKLDVSKIRQLCEAHKVPEEDLPFDTVKVVIINPTKLEALLQRGVLPPEKILAMREELEVETLRMEKSPAMQNELKRFKPKAVAKKTAKKGRVKLVTE